LTFPQKRSPAALTNGHPAELNAEGARRVIDRRVIEENRRGSDPAHEVNNEKNDQYRPKNAAADVHGNLRW
jgi:hypothetical protein